MDIKQEIKYSLRTSLWICLAIWSLPWWIIFSIIVMVYFWSFEKIKEKFFPYVLYIPVHKDQTQRAKTWIHKNIKGLHIVEEVICFNPFYSYYGEEYFLDGWNYRFMRKSDFVAFKLVWSQL